MLDSYRVLDLTDDRGHLAGMLLAQLGADVIAVELPEGQRARHLAPFAGDELGPERSLTHWAYNRGKRSVVFDGPGDLVTLARGADVVLESGAYPVDLAALRSANPALVTASITPYGEHGPKARWAATDLTVAAASGTLNLTGDRDRPPVRMTIPQTWHFAALDALAGTMIALIERNRSGLGQHLDVSAQESFISANQFQMIYPLVGQQGGERLSGGMQLGPITLRFVHSCLDGVVTIAFLFGPIFGPYTIRLFEWMRDEGFCGPEWLEIDWVGFGLALTSDPEAIELLDRGTDILHDFVATKTKDEMMAAALERGLLFAPGHTTRELLDLEHSAIRQFWDMVDGHRYPGPFARTDPPLARLDRAPRLGEHTAAVLAEPLRAPAVTTPTAAWTVEGDLPLAGVNVLDFCWALAGPGATRLLADHGATVVRVESQAMPDAMRGAGPFISTDGGAEDSIQWHSANASKLGFAANLKASETREVVHDLIRWADIVTESFAAGKLAALGYGYDDIAQVNPEVIMLSSCLMGQTGPMASYAGFGTMGAAMAGFYPVVGWPDRPPCGPYGAYSDYMSPRYTVAALLAALDHRRRTGRGQYIDYSQMEGAAHLLSVALLDEEVNGRTATRNGNRDPNMAPHGVYPVAGDDRWIAIAAQNDEAWKALATVIDLDSLSDLSTAERLERAAELDDRVATNTADRDGAELEAALQEAGVAAQRVLRPEDVVEDPQLVHRQQFQRADHPVHGTSWVETPAFELHRTPGRVAWAGPTFGQHLWEVLTDILGYDEDRAAELIATGAFE